MCVLSISVCLAVLMSFRGHMVSERQTNRSVLNGSSTFTLRGTNWQKTVSQFRIILHYISVCSAEKHSKNIKKHNKAKKKKDAEAKKKVQILLKTEAASVFSSTKITHNWESNVSFKEQFCSNVMVLPVGFNALTKMQFFSTSVQGKKSKTILNALTNFYNILMYTCIYNV